MRPGEGKAQPVSFQWIHRGRPSEKEGRLLAQVISAALQGVESYLVRVEVNLGNGIPSFAVVGLAEGAVREGRERVWAAIQNSGYPIPPRKITVNLAPADIRKEGSAFDLPLALGLLAGAGQIPCEGLVGMAVVGELAAGIAHEINNPLAIISGTAEMLLMDMEDADRGVKKKILTIKEQTERIAGVTEKLRNIRRDIVTDYVEGTRMIDIQKAS